MMQFHEWYKAASETEIMLAVLMLLAVGNIIRIRI
jgi:hypothetical protein